MEKNINNTKKNLTITFVILVFFIVLFIGISFFSVKYFKVINTEKKGFVALVKSIDKKRYSLNDVLRKDFKSYLGGNRKNRGPINYVLFGSSKNILSINLRDDIDEGFLENINKKDKFLSIFRFNGFFVRKFSFNKGSTFIVFQKIRYNFYDYITDIFGFFIANLLLAVFLYFIGKKFVNKAFVPVEQNIDDMKNFIHNAGHELKTPLSVINSNLQIIEELKVYNSSMIGEIKSEIYRLNSLIDSLIRLSYLNPLKNKEKLDLKKIVSDVLDDFKFRIKEKKIDVNIDIKKDVFLFADKDYFYMFVTNLLGNAIKYNKKGGKINISFKSSELIIEDTGIGISNEDLGKVFDRFFKSDKSRNSEGFGIGLSLVKKIGDIYGWNINISSTEGNGTKIVVGFK